MGQSPGPPEPTCPHGYPQSRSGLICPICSVEQYHRALERSRATAGALIHLGGQPGDPDRDQDERTRLMFRALGAASIILFVASIALLTLRTRHHHSTVSAIPALTTISIPLPPSSAAVTSLRPTEAIGCPQVAFAPLDARRAANCLYLAWKSDDQKGTQFYATVAAVETLFARPWRPPDVAFLGCDPEPGPPTPLPRQLCRYPGLVMRVECAAGQGCSVVDVTVSGSG